jgi:propanol-preferring alcohol dehydrogenase
MNKLLKILWIVISNLRLYSQLISKSIVRIRNLCANRITQSDMDTTYRAIQAIAPGKLQAIDLPISQPPSGHVRVRIEACGVCHTDAVTVEGGFPGSTYPRVPGHEVVGRIYALGPGVEEWRVGQRVGIGFLGGHCGVCPRCRRGDFVNCERQAVSGLHSDGGYAEIMIAKANALAAIPDELNSVEAAPLLCAGLTTFNALRKAQAHAGDLVAIQGVGGLGHLAIQYAKHMGFKVAAIARGADKRDLAMKLGAHHYVDSSTQDPAAELQRLGGARIILATAANSKSMSALVSGLGAQGELIIAGVGGDAPMEINAVPLIFGERSIVGTLTGRSIDGEDTLAFSVLQGIRAMVETFPLAEAQQAYRRMMNNEARFRVVLVTGH